MSVLLLAALAVSPACRRGSDKSSSAPPPPPGSAAEAKVAAQAVAGLKGCLPANRVPRGKALRAAAATNFSLATAQFAAAGKVAPAEVRTEYTVVASTMRRFPTLLGTVDGDYAKVLTDPKFAQAASVVKDAEFHRASQRLGSWFAENCEASLRT
ncbi:MAG TPA: hypothetical protein VNB24_09470 [Acidimicrobiales bacterium]|nr:hypothetical protein [Acidimicrobiales bacterium]